MTVEITQDALDVLRRSLELGNVPTSGGIRLRGARTLGGGFDVQVELASEPMEGDSIVTSDGLNIFIEPAIAEMFPEPLVALEPQHDRIVVRSQADG